MGARPHREQLSVTVTRLDHISTGPPCQDFTDENVAVHSYGSGVTETPPSKPWRWPGEWLRQESFWRDVGSRTLAGVFAGLLLYIGAVLLGYVQRPGVWRVLLVVSTLTLAAIGAIVVGYVFVQRSRFLGKHGIRGYEASRFPKTSRRPALYLAVAATGAALVNVLASTQDQS